MAFSDCLQALRSLETLLIRKGLKNAWSLKSFRAVAKHQSLKQAELRAIPTSWLRGIENNSERGIFRNIEGFTAGLSEDGLRLILPYLAKTTSLTIYLTEPSSQALRICAAAPSLLHIKLGFDARCIVRARDLILFAEAHNALFALELGSEDEDDLPSADDITDATMDQVARLLPNLEILKFYVAGTAFTESSLLSLGTFCKWLVSCSVYGHICFEELVRRAPNNLYPTLGYLQVL